MNKLIFILLISSIGFGDQLSPNESIQILMSRSGKIHATPHVTNLIRKGASTLTEYEKSHLHQFGLEHSGNIITPARPNDLDQIYDTNHFRFFFTLDSSDYDAVEDFEYVESMAQVFEQVWTFFSDSLGYDMPPTDPNNSHGLYEIYIENLPSYYFGVTYTSTASIEPPKCASYIKMRNSYSGSQFSDHTELENIQVTAVHEFFHSIQFAYNCYERFWMMEASAVWVEDEMYNDINDLYRYMPSWFSNPDKPIDTETSHMYGSFIYFQYLDEHHGGPDIIRACWESSRENYSPVYDISFNAIDDALAPQLSSFDITYHKMRIANRILSSNANAAPYNYEEAEGYLTVVTIPDVEDYIFFEKGDITTKQNNPMSRYESLYYELTLDSPVSISIFPSEGDFLMSTIAKLDGKNEWSIRTGTNINIDPSIDIDYLSIVISSIGRNETNWDMSLQIKDGYSEDFTVYNPYPNPSLGQSVSLELHVIKEQSIDINLFNILGQQVWSTNLEFTEPTIESIQWDGINIGGQRVSDGIYFFEINGESKRVVKKVTLLKKSN